MSLLLEALKKAEKAKEEAQRRANGDAPAADPAPASAASAAAERKPVLTRDKLPDISGSLEIVSDDLEPARPAAAAPAMELEPVARPAETRPGRDAAAAPGPRRGVPPADETGRATARKVFEAKFREPNPRMPFYITLGVLGLFALGTAIYFWYQLRPASPLVNLNPARPAENVVAAAPTGAAGTSPSANTGRETAIPGLPGMPEPPAAQGAPRPAVAPPARPPARAQLDAPPPAPRAAPAAVPRVVPAEAPKLAPALSARTALGAAAATPQPTVTRSAPQVNPFVESGFAAYEAGDLAKARSDYEQALRDEPANRDALLGLAALNVRAARYESAEALYLRVLRIDPRDAEAQAALLALRAGRSDPLATESRVKSLLAVEPDAPALTFTLGNQLAQQNRWAEAHQQYLKAYTADPENADFAYNVAVSLDHLHQPREALEYYQRALALARTRGAGFDAAAAQARAAQLGR